MSPELRKEKQAVRGMVSLKSTKWKMTDNSSNDFGIMKGQHVVGRPGSSTILSITPPSSKKRNMGSAGGSVSRL